MTVGHSAVKSIELFVGAGGLALGSARAGFKHVAVIDCDRNACNTLRRNKADGVDHVREWDVIEDDVRAYDFKQYEGQVQTRVGWPSMPTLFHWWQALGTCGSPQLVPTGNSGNSRNTTEGVHA